MKNFLVVFIVFGLIAAGAIAYLNKDKAPRQLPAPVADSTINLPAPAAPENTSAPKFEAPHQILPADEPVKLAATAPAAVETASADSTNPIHKLVDDLLSAKNGADKNKMLQQLVKSGQIEQAIAELKQRAADNPNDPEIPTTLGEAQLNEAGAIHAAGGDINEQGILAMQADQSFNAALKIDPQNFEAQLVKSIAMSYWPADPARDAQVVQTFSSLIDRQETMVTQPEFAQAYIYLGNEYQKIGQPEKAQATWQLGLQKFPGNQTLQAKLNGQ